jgi:hypothetical protein
MSNTVTSPNPDGASDCLEGVIASQREWARRNHRAVTDNGHVDSVNANLRAPLSDAARAAFSKGSGGELNDTDGKPAKMRSVISSSALAVNAFDYWSKRNLTALGNALHLNERILDLHFEVKRPTGAKGTPPNLDVDLVMDGGRVVGFESKFTEWMCEKDLSVAMLRSYFDGEDSRWLRAKFPCAHRLACDIRDGRAPFCVLDVPQLLKHALGLRRAASSAKRGFSLFYVYYDWQCPLRERHLREIDSFAERVGKELDFRSISYQNLLTDLGSGLQAADDRAYLAWLTDRYFSDPRARL